MSLGSQENLCWSHLRRQLFSWKSLTAELEGNPCPTARGFAFTREGQSDKNQAIKMPMFLAPWQMSLLVSCGGRAEGRLTCRREAAPSSGSARGRNWWPPCSSRVPQARLKARCFALSLADSGAGSSHSQLHLHQEGPRACQPSLCWEHSTDSPSCSAEHLCLVCCLGTRSFFS